MAEFAIQRKTMVDNQIRTVDVTDPAVIAAFSKVPREVFVPKALERLAYVDRPVEASPGRFVMEPALLAKLVQLAAPRESEKVLIVGGNTGYSAAIFAELAASVTVLESDAALADAAEAALSGTAGVRVVRGPLVEGAPAGAPYDLIFFDGSFEVLPETFAAQLAEGGRLVGLQGVGLAAAAVVGVVVGGELSTRQAFNLQGQPLPGFAKVREFAL